MNDSDILLRPIGGFFGLGLLDVPPVVDSIWQAWMSNGRPAVMAWTARAALKWLIDLRRPGKVWLPAYTCRQLATAAPQSDLRFYPLTCEHSPNIPFLQQHVRAGDLVMATNFFGWAPDEEFIASAAERPDVIWVEDRAHCLWMERQPWASWLLYSPRKLLGVPDGGILITQDRSMFPESSWGSGDAAVAIPELMRFEDRNEIDNSTWHAAFRCREARFSAELRPMSQLTAALLRRIPLRLLVEARQPPDWIGTDVRSRSTHCRLACLSARPSPRPGVSRLCRPGTSEPWEMRLRACIARRIWHDRRSVEEPLDHAGLPQTSV